MADLKVGDWVSGAGGAKMQIVEIRSSGRCTVRYRQGNYWRGAQLKYLSPAAPPRVIHAT